MLIHLHCPHCPCHFSAPADTPATAILDRMRGDAPWFTLPEGDTFEDMVFAGLSQPGMILCPRCRREALVGGDRSGQLFEHELLQKQKRQESG